MLVGVGCWPCNATRVVAIAPCSSTCWRLFPKTPPSCPKQNKTMQVVAIAPALLPELLAILKGDEYGAALQRKALAILHTILEVLQVSSGVRAAVYKDPYNRLTATGSPPESSTPKRWNRLLPLLPAASLQELASGATLASVKSLLASILPGWLAEFARILSQPLQPDVRSVCFIGRRGWWVDGSGSPSSLASLTTCCSPTCGGGGGELAAVVVSCALQGVRAALVVDAEFVPRPASACLASAPASPPLPLPTLQCFMKAGP